jgi:hypothetical protein
MISKRWILACGAALLALASMTMFAKQQGRGHGKNKGDKGTVAHAYRYGDHEREILRGYYREHENNLPPGLAKRDELPPGLARQLVRRGTLPPGLRKKVQPCPLDLLERLPQPPPNYEHALIGGRVLLLNRRTNLILDVFHVTP